MNQLITKAIVLSRTEYGEADRIVTLITPDNGKLTLMAKGVRRAKSKLAGGIELFSVSDITYIKGRGEVGTLISSRLEKHYAKIVNELSRVQLGYDLIRILHKVTEDSTETEYFSLLKDTFEALDKLDISLSIIKPWFEAKLLAFAGYSPNLSTDIEGGELGSGSKYNFNMDQMCFVLHPSGRYDTNTIKVLRLLFSNNSPVVLGRVKDLDDNLDKPAKLTGMMYASHF
jgi:DNA repair protein RecO